MENGHIRFIMFGKKANKFKTSEGDIRIRSEFYSYTMIIIFFLYIIFEGIN